MWADGNELLGCPARMWTDRNELLGEHTGISVDRNELLGGHAGMSVDRNEVLGGLAKGPPDCELNYAFVLIECRTSVKNVFFV